MFAALLVLIGCFDTSRLDEVLGDGAIPPVEGDRVIWTSPVQSLIEATPAWAQGTLPLDSSVLTDTEAAGVVDQACEGDVALLEGLSIRIEAAREQGRTTRWEWDLLDQCVHPGPRFCEWVRDFSGPDVTEVQRFWWHLAGGCLNPQNAEWMARPGAPQAAIVDFMAHQDDQYRPVSLTGAAKALRAHLDDGTIHHARALQALGSVDDPEHARMLLAQKDADQWLYRQSDPQAKARFSAWCAENENPQWQCLEAFGDTSASALTNVSVDLSSLLVRHPERREDLLDGIQRCVQSAAVDAEPRGDRCLRALAGVPGGWSRLHKALDHPDENLYEGWVAIRDGVQRYSDSESMRADLVARGLIPEGVGSYDEEEPPADVLVWMIETGRGLWIPASPGRAVAQALARVPGLAHLSVAQRDPPFNLQDSDRTLYVELLLWDGRYRHRALFPASGAFNIQLAGVLNQMAEKAGESTRFVVPSGWNILVWGTPESLRKASDDGLLRIRSRSMQAPSQ